MAVISKTTQPGHKLRGIRSLSFMPAISTVKPCDQSCPVVTPFCRGECGNKPCYAFQPVLQYTNTRKAWAENYRLWKSNSFDFEIEIMKGLKNQARFRWFVGGDIPKYRGGAFIKMMIRIAKATPECQHFGFTRTWMIPEYRKLLNVLRKLPNVQYFASHDPTMPKPPNGWRVADIAMDLPDALRLITDDPLNRNVICPEQLEKVRYPQRRASERAVNCKKCGYCMRNGGSVIFLNH